MMLAGLAQRSLGAARRWLSQDVRVMILGTHDPRTGNVTEDTWSSIRAGDELVSSRLSSGQEETGASMHVVFAGASSSQACEQVAEQTSRNASLGRHYISKKALALTDDRLEHGLAEAYAPCLAGLHATHAYDYIISADTTYSRNLLPRLGATIDVEPIHGIVQICEGGHRYTRSMYAGSILCKVEVPVDSVQLLTCRSGNFPNRIMEIKQSENNLAWSTETVNDISRYLLGPLHLPTTFLSQSKQGSEGSTNLSHAKIVVAGGRAFSSKEEFQKLEFFAQKIGAAVGATRALVDAGIVPNDMQIVQTGKIIAPDLYIAFGISGAIQHMAGIKDSGRIIAINSDREAPIFDAADFGLVGNVHHILDQLLNSYSEN